MVLLHRKVDNGGVLLCVKDVLCEASDVENEIVGQSFDLEALHGGGVICLALLHTVLETRVS